MWLLIIIVIVLLLRAMATSKTAATVNQITKSVCSQPTAGDSFTQGNTIAAGVPEPPIHSVPKYLGPPVHCCHIVAGTFCGLPAHVIYPVAPPPVRIQQPVLPSPPRTAPGTLPLPSPIRTVKTYPIRPIRPTMLCCSFTCIGSTCVGGGGGGGLFGSGGRTL